MELHYEVMTSIDSNNTTFNDHISGDLSKSRIFFVYAPEGTSGGIFLFHISIFLDEVCF